MNKRFFWLADDRGDICITRDLADSWSRTNMYYYIFTLLVFANMLSYMNLYNNENVQFNLLFISYIIYRGHCLRVYDVWIKSEVLFCGLWISTLYYCLIYTNRKIKTTKNKTNQKQTSIRSCNIRRFWHRITLQYQKIATFSSWFVPSTITQIK